MTGDTHEQISMDTNSRLARLEQESRETQKKVNDIHRRLCESSNVGEPPLIDRLGKAVRAYEQTSWLGKTGIWAVLTLGSLAAAFSAVANFMQRMGKQ